ncbi:unnamed protein product [Caenorhabditis bovis]|uniref:Uncharacterized protein n=1 Tax=Caenorhabditis bovis TaxID=2654633 RepID=A0A8S1F722_9PELO|nr:unnamed protein product [Caenorhabditis bovis]
MDRESWVVMEFHRENQINEALVDGNGKQIKVGGVVHPRKPLFWNTIKPVQVDPEKIVDIEPDVWVSAWIVVNCVGTSPENAKITFSFGNFDCFDETQQFRVSQAPWNSGIISKFSTVMAEPDPADEELEIDCDKPEAEIRPQDRWADVVLKQIGIYIGDRTVVSKDLPQYDFIVPLRQKFTKREDGSKAIYPLSGEYVYFCASWSTIHKNFLITSMATASDMRPHKVTKMGFIRISIIQDETYNGLFRDLNRTLGYIDDPARRLALWPLFSEKYTTNKIAKVEVVAVRATENKMVRYRVVRRVSEDSDMEQFESWIQTDEESVFKNITGIVVSTDGTVVSAVLPNIIFSLPEGTRPHPIGTNVKFDAMHESGFDKELKIIKYKVIAGETTLSCARRYIPPNVHKKTMLLRVYLYRVPSSSQLLHSPILGYVDRRNINIDDLGQMFPGWVMMSPTTTVGRRACTMFELLTTSVAPPVDDETMKRSAGSSLAGSTHGSRCSHNSSILSSRFNGPAFQTMRSSSEASLEGSGL